MKNIVADPLKIIALPFAGGNKYCYKNIQECIPEWIDWITLETPGRGMRFREDLKEDIRLLADDLFLQIKEYVCNEPYVIYGHSMGALLGYEVAKRIINSPLGLPECLFFTGSGAPSALSTKKMAELPNRLFWKKVHDFGGLPSEVLKNEDLLTLYYPILKSDFRAIESYKYHKMKMVFPFPIFVCMGEDEIGEKPGKTSIENVKKWNKETLFPQKIELLKGNHFFVLNHPKAIIHEIIKSYQSIPTSSLMVYNI